MVSLHFGRKSQVSNGCKMYLLRSSEKVSTCPGKRTPQSGAKRSASFAPDHEATFFFPLRTPFLWAASKGKPMGTTSLWRPPHRKGRQLLPTANPTFVVSKFKAKRKTAILPRPPSIYIYIYNFQFYGGCQKENQRETTRRGCPQRKDTSIFQLAPLPSPPPRTMDS